MPRFSSDVKQDRAYSQPEDAKDAQIVNPEWSRQTSATLADVTNAAAGTYDYYVDMTGYRGCTIQFEKVGGTDTLTLKVYGSCQNDGTAAASCLYDDITQYGMDVITAGTAAASYTDDVILSLVQGTNFKYLHVEVVASGGADDGDYKIYVKQWY